MGRYDNFDCLRHRCLDVLSFVIPIKTTAKIYISLGVDRYRTCVNGGFAIDV